MNAAVLCPGPSLCQFAGNEDRYDLVLGVNRAALRFTVNVWVFIDWHSFTRIDRRPTYKPFILTTRCSLQGIERKHQWEAFRAHDHTLVDDLATDCPRTLGWTIWSKTVAMVYAHHRGAVRIDLYGDDMAGTLDFDGTTYEMDRRDEDRWKREAEVTRNVVDWLHERGCTVERKR